MNEEKKRGRKDSKGFRAPCLVSDTVAMEGKGPYRIYDPGGSEAKARDEAGGGSSYRMLLEENSVLRERMKGLKSLGDLLEESQSEASRLRQRVEELVRDNEALKSSSFATSLCMGGPIKAETQGLSKPNGHLGADQRDGQSCLTGRALQCEQPTEGLAEFEVVNMEDKAAECCVAGSAVGATSALHLPQENMELATQLQKLESSFSIFAEESNPNQLLAHLGRMAVEFHHLSSKVQKNEQRTSLLQTLCEQLRQENNELRKKMEEDLQYRNRDLEQLRQENLKLKEMVTGEEGRRAEEAEPAGSEAPETKEDLPTKEEAASVRSKMEVTTPQKSGKATEKAATKPCDPEVYEKKIKLLEKQRKDVLEVNKQWDIQWNSMKSQFEQKITDLRQRLADSQKAVLELEAEREQRQRDYDKKLLLAKSKIENVQGEKECLNTETTELKQKVRYLQDQLLPLTKQREYQEKEIQRLNRALEEALNLHPPSTSQPPPGQTAANHGDGPSNQRKQELLTQIAVLKEQVKIFEEDFRKERSDRERMNEEKEDLRRQVERMQGQMTNLTNQLHQKENECQRERAERCKLERLQMQHHKQGHHHPHHHHHHQYPLLLQPERRTSDPSTGSVQGPLSTPYCGPFVQVVPQGPEGWPVHHPPRIPNAASAAASAAAAAAAAASAAPPPGRDFQPVAPGFPWQSSFPQSRGSRGTGEGSRPPPENADQSTAAGFGKRERQNIDPGKH